MQNENVFKENLNGISTLSLVQMALMIAMTCVATMFIQIPTIFGIRYDHLGYSRVFLGVILYK